MATSHSKSILLLLCLSLSHYHVVSGLQYGLNPEPEELALSLTDVQTEITDVQTIFTKEQHSVTVSGIEWTPLETNATNATAANYVLVCQTFVGSEEVYSGEMDLADLPSDRDLPTEMECGTFSVSKNGRYEVSVVLTVLDTSASTSNEYEAFAPGAAIVPLLIVLILALTTQMVEFSLFFAIFVGACMVTGNVKDGFKTLLDNYILNALASVDHGYVYLFTLFLSGLVGMMEKSGGMIGFTNSVAKYAKTPVAGQMATFFVGVIVFFDDYANTLLAGQTMRPLTDMLFVSREKLAFIVDATAAPIASISPISSWVGFEVGLIQTEIDRIIALVGEDNITIETSGLAVFFQSIKYRYYPIFMIILMPTLILTRREFGPMLVAERKTQVYKRTDGGDGAMHGNKYGVGLEPEEKIDNDENAPRDDTPKKSWNMMIPILLLVFFIFFLLVQTGDDGSGTQSFMDKIENSDSYSSLLWGTMAAANITTIMYMVQIVQDGHLVLPTWGVIKGLFSRDCNSQVPTKKTHEADDAHMEGEETDKMVVPEEQASSSSKPRPLMSLYETMESFLYGMGRIFPALIVLTLAWASGSIMIAVGADRLFSRWIVGGVSAEALPTLSFIISAFMALATGTSWGTMTILFPLICIPTYQVSNGDPTIFYATVAGILSGSVAGDHASPISDTTVLSSLASDCKLLAHVSTQAPYAILMSILAILFGTLPIGRGAWPNIVGILLGAVAILIIAYGLCVPILSPTGRYDIFTMLVLKYKGEGSDLQILQEETVRLLAEEAAAANGEEEAPLQEEVEELNPKAPEVVMDDVDEKPDGSSQQEAEIEA